MWMVIIPYEYDNDIYVFEKMKDAQLKYEEEKRMGQIVYLTKIVKTNM